MIWLCCKDGEILFKMRAHFWYQRGCSCLKEKSGHKNIIWWADGKFLFQRRIVQSLFELQEVALRQTGNSQRAESIINRMNNMQSEMVRNWENERASRIASQLQSSTRSARFFQPLAKHDSERLVEQ